MCVLAQSASSRGMVQYTNKLFCEGKVGGPEENPLEGQGRSNHNSAFYMSFETQGRYNEF